MLDLNYHQCYSHSRQLYQNNLVNSFTTLLDDTVGVKTNLCIDDTVVDAGGTVVAATTVVPGTVTNIVGVEEKFEKYFGYLARCEEFFVYRPYKKTKQAKINQNARKMMSKFENRALKTLFEI